MMRLRRSKSIVCCALMLALFGLASCGTTKNRGNTFTPTEVNAQSEDFYLRQLQNLPLRFYEEGRWHINLSNGPDTPAVREVHMMRDTAYRAVLREEKPTDPLKISSWRDRRSDALHKDTLLIVRDDNTVVSVAARTFTVNWVTRIAKRVPYAPIMTKDSIFFIDAFGRYERLDRHTGVVTTRDIFGTGFFPNAQPAANDSHIIIPTTNSNAVEGRPDDDASNSTNPLLWRFPSNATGSVTDFGMVLSQPIADTNNIYFVSNDNHLYCLRASDGRKIWAVKLETVGIIRTTPVLQDGMIYVGSDTQLFAVNLEGKVTWTYSADGEVFEGPIYAMDNQVFARTARVEAHGGENKGRAMRIGLTTQETKSSEYNVKPSRMLGLTFKRQRGATEDRTIIKGPTKADFELENLGQRVLLKTANDVFLIYEEWDIPYDRRTQERLRASGKVVNDQELRDYSRRIVQVIDPKTGEVRKHQGETASYELVDFSFILGSHDDTDRALYFCTKDGHLYKGFELSSESR